MKKSIIFLGITVAIFIGAPHAMTAQAGIGAARSAIQTKIPFKKVIKWVGKIKRGYVIYDRVSGNRVNCEEAYNYAKYAYGEYEHFYALAQRYWGSDYGNYFHSEAIRAYRVAEHFHTLVYHGCR
jgi:hypothetical protein